MTPHLPLGHLASAAQADPKPLKEAPHKSDVIYNIEEGPQVRTTMVEMLGVRHTNRDLITRHVKVPVGKPLSEETILTAERNLYDLEAFDWASVDPLKPITTESDNEVLIKVHEAKRNQITYGFGFDVINKGGSVPGGTVALPNLPPVGLPNTFKTSQQ